MTTPRTAAGRALLTGECVHCGEEHAIDVTAIEAEARAAALDEARAALDALTPPDRVMGAGLVHYVMVEPALAAIDALRERSGETPQCAESDERPCPWCGGRRSEFPALRRDEG